MSNKPKVLFFSGSAWHSRELGNIRFSDNLRVPQQTGAVQHPVVTEDMNTGQHQTLQLVSGLIGSLFTVLEGLIELLIRKPFFPERRKPVSRHREK